MGSDSLAALSGKLQRVVKLTPEWSANSWCQHGQLKCSGCPWVASPWQTAIDHGHLWISDTCNVVEVNAFNGSVMRVVNGAADDFLYDQNIVDEGTLVWVSNYYGNSLAELSAKNGALLRLIK